MEIQGRVKEEVVILDLAGRLDVNAANLIESVGHCLRDGYRDILLNFEDIEFIDYMGVSVVAIAYKEVANNKGRIKFVNLAPHLKELFLVTGIDRVIDIYSTEELALLGFKEEKVIEDIRKMQLRRRFKRVPIDIKIELKDKYASAPHCLKLDIINLSAIGAYIYGCDKFKLGDDVILSFKLPPKMEEMELQARVVWLSDKQIQPHIHPGMAVEFSSVSTGEQAKILEFVERNLTLKPTED